MRLQVESLHVDSKGRLPAEMWYKLNHSDFSGSFAGATIQFTHLFNDAVRLRMRADVPVGSCLSGGLDSSSIVCVMNKLLRDQGAKNPQKTFSACTCIERYDERTWIDEVVRATGVDAYYVYPSLENLFEELPAITWHQDEPFGSSSIYAQWNVFRLAAQNGVKVMLDGQGADEHLAGYREFFFARLAGLFYGGNLMRFWQEVQANKNQHGHSVLYSLANTIKILLPPSLKINLRRMKINQATPLWLNLDVLGAEAVNYTDNLNNYSKSVRALSYSQLTMTSIQTLLHCEDRDSMAHSIESRVPFLDYRLVEFVLGLPDEFKLSDGVTKRVLRKGMSGILPDRIRNRSDKLGFVTPEEIWVKEHAPALFRSKLQKAVDSSQGILSAKSICMLDDIIDARIPFDFRLWRMISFGEWMEVFSARN
jgi:asparagine synthase (glutamine-hydrolysing)